MVAAGVREFTTGTKSDQHVEPREQHESVRTKIRTGPDGQFFLYPEHATSDAVPEFVEDTTFGAHPAAMFLRDASASSRQLWDTESEYVDHGLLVVYAMTRRKDVCRASGGGAVGPDGKGFGLEVKDGCLIFVVVTKVEVKRKWVEE